VRALAARANRKISAATISALTLTSERRMHSTPSGIDQSVIMSGRPIWFINSSGNMVVAPVNIATPFTLLVGDTGIRSRTYLPVGAVRQCWRHDLGRYERLFDAVGALAIEARDALAAGDMRALGTLLSRNHVLLRQIGVSSPELNRLVVAAHRAGALGAKLSGGGWGGVMIALVTPETQAQVTTALLDAGAVRVLTAPVSARYPRASSVSAASALPAPSAAIARQKTAVVSAY
jgi:mevalonate kinase